MARQLKWSSEALLMDLEKETRLQLLAAEALKSASFERLNHKASDTTWSALECIEHLNRYGAYYLPEIKKRILASRYPPESSYRAGWLGAYFAESMLPRKQVNRMKTFRSMNPNGSRLEKATIDTFIEQVKMMLELLDLAKGVSLSRTKTSISISRWIKLQLGNTLRVVIYHNRRHLLQAQKALSFTES